MTTESSSFQIHLWSSNTLVTSTRQNDKFQPINQLVSIQIFKCPCNDQGYPADLSKWGKAIEEWLGHFNLDLEKVNHAEADAAWNASVRITGENEEILSLVQKFK